MLKIFHFSSDQVERKVKSSSILTRLRRAQLGQSRSKVSEESQDITEHRLSLGPSEGPSPVKQGGSQSCPSSPGITRRCLTQVLLSLCTDTLSIAGDETRSGRMSLKAKHQDKGRMCSRQHYIQTTV